MTFWMPVGMGWLPWAGNIPPAFIFLGSAILVALCRKESRRPLQRLLLVATPVVGAANLLALNSESTWIWHFLGLEVVVLESGAEHTLLRVRYSYFDPSQSGDVSW